MCCIFTCCGWVIDLVQRFWAFAMSCCICSAVCCVLVVISISGIALGYNYSLAEYIDLKETNVSVYMKRGVFDDAAQDDLDWRRRGHMPVGGHINEENLVTPSNDGDEYPKLNSRRKLDDSIYGSEDQHKFEGSLLKLTAGPPEIPSPVVLENDKAFDRSNEVMNEYPKGSMDQLKAIQSLINMQKSALAESNRRSYQSDSKISLTNTIDQRYIPPFPYIKHGARRVMSEDPDITTPPSNSYRLAVPDQGIGESAKWYRPKLPPNSLEVNLVDGPIDITPTYPSPVTPRVGPVRPTRPKYVAKVTKAKAKEHAARTQITSKVAFDMIKPIRRLPDKDVDGFKENLLIDKFNEFRGPTRTSNTIPEGDDYENVLKNSYLNVRKKRQLIVPSSIGNNTSETVK